MSEEKKKQVIALGQLGWSLRQIQKTTGIRRETAAGYLKAAGVEVRRPGGWGKKAAFAKPSIDVINGSAAKPATQVITGSAATDEPQAAESEPSPGSTGSLSAPYRELIDEGLSRGRNVMSIWQELVDRHGFAGTYQSVTRYVRKLDGPRSPEARAVIRTAPGEEAQVDYGTGPSVRDPNAGKHRRTRLFVMTLGYGRKCVRLLTFQSSTRIWAELHERAFLKLGGAVKVVVPDNLREGVLAPDYYDPTLNPLYRDLSHSLWCRGYALPDRRPGSEGQSRVRCRPRPEDTTERTAF